MPTPLDPAEEHALTVILDHAAKVFNRALAAYENKRFTDYHAQALTREEYKLSDLLCGFLDGPYYGLLDADTLEHMLDYVEEAEALLYEAAPPCACCATTCSRIAPGRYVVARSLTIEGQRYLNERAVTNPAVGLAQLDAWEADLRQSLVRIAA